ncbi:MAG TPA: zinc-ribbon domain-containing protein [Tepidisphaeraceae bacterium]|jgi:tetratricopeptide (TPR) repeat protein
MGNARVTFIQQHPRRSGFILLFGTRPVVSNDPAAGEISTLCPRCGRQATIVGKSYRNWFTLFFIPVFPVSGAKTFSQCTSCGGQFPVPLRELTNRVRDSDRAQAQRAITMYNSLRASPANSITLNELMALYASMGEYDQAISAAGEFAQALNNSEQCMTTLARVYLATDQHEEALRWLEAATTRNANLGEAHYYKAVAHLTKPAPDPHAAITAARAARNASYPGAEELLKEAESRARA